MTLTIALPRNRPTLSSSISVASHKLIRVIAVVVMAITLSIGGLVAYRSVAGAAPAACAAQAPTSLTALPVVDASGKFVNSSCAAPAAASKAPSAMSNRVDADFAGAFAH